MPATLETDFEELVARARAAAVTTLVSEAQATWAERATTSPHDPVAGPRPFEDAFPTFYQFSNRPQR
jgi:hypothetical protein